MTLTEYMSPERFPLTTCPGLTPGLQFLSDAHEHDRLRKYVMTGVTPTLEEWRMLEELQVKADARPGLLTQLGEQEPAGRTEHRGPVHELDDPAAFGRVTARHEPRASRSPAEYGNHLPGRE